MRPNGDQQHQHQHQSAARSDASVAGVTMNERKRAAAAFVDAATSNGDGNSRADPRSVDGAGAVLSGADTARSTTFQVWSRDSHTFCTECEDTGATVLCQGCDEPYCSLCWAALHRRGERAKHGTTPLGSEEDLAPPPEALEESGWLAGVWPSQRPRPNQSNAVPSSAEARGPPEPQQQPEGSTLGGPGVAKNGGVDGCAMPTPAAASVAAVGGESQLTTGAAVAGGEEPSSSAVGGDGDGDGGVDVGNGNGNGNGGGGARRGERARGREDSGPAGVTKGSATAIDVGGEKQVGAARVAGDVGNGAVALGGAVTTGEEARPKRAKLHGTTSDTRPKPEAKSTKEVEAAPTMPGEKVAQSGHGSGGGGGSGSRPEGYEGPLCPSGDYFSKPETPPPSPKAAKRPRSSPPPAHKNASPAGAALLNGNGTAVKGGEEQGKAEVGLGVELGLDENREADIAGGVRHGRGSQKSDRGSENDTSADGGGAGESNGRAVSQGGAKKKCENGVEGGGGEGNGVSTAGGEAAGGAAVPAAEASAGDSDAMDVDAPLFSAKAIAAAAAAAAAASKGGADKGAGAMDVELPLFSSNASSAITQNGGAGGGDAAAVGPAREATKEEKRGLEDLKRRSTNIPLRLDPREREILGVLEGSLHHMQYTDAVDRILRGNRLPHVLRNLMRFFTSVWGMYKASGVASPTYSPPNSGAAAAGAKAKRPLVPPHFNSGDGRAGPSPLMMPRSAFGKARASASNGTSNGGGSGLSTLDGVGGTKGVGAGGGVGYREDSFEYKRTGWNYTLDWACVLRTCCEVGRRHKILNPEKMRSAHGMLMCILMDTEHPQVRGQTGFSCVRKMRTAFGLSASTGLLGLFEDPDLLTASRPVLPWERDQRLQKSGRNTEELAVQAKEKAEARRRLLARHGVGGLECEVKLLVDSVADSIVYREISTRPIRRMLSLLKHHWRPDRTDDARKNANLGIQYGEFGARLTHNHRTQFYFVMQSLMLWLEVLDHMLDLWAAGERDMLDERNQYRLSNTGQGLQRVQGASRVGKRMHEYQARVNAESGRPWVGSAVVHLGDNCVPNALTFLDKYSQVPWILNPILQALDYLSDLEKGSDPAVLIYVKERWGSVEYAQRYILRHFFRFGFDGSGGDNNYDAGSCVDGRLTSAWNWCSKLEKRSFLYIFLLSGFSGFDGDFSR